MSRRFLPQFTPIHLSLLASVAFALVLASCGGSNRVTISATRELPPDEQKPKLHATERERFRFALPATQPQQETSGPRLAWDVPEGWSESASASSMREVSLIFGENGSGECYVMRAGGSITANVNRWRSQMNLDPLPESAIAELPRRPLFGMQAVAVEMAGDYTGVGAGEAKQDYRLLGVILPVSSTSLFVKMIGPADAVEANRAKFEAFCDSLRVEQS